MGNERGDHRPLFAEGLAFYGEKKAMLEFPWKLIYDPAAGDAALYDLANDPREQRNLAFEQPERTQRRTEEIRSQLAPDVLSPLPRLSSEEEDALRALGYAQ